MLRVRRFGTSNVEKADLSAGTNTATATNREIAVSTNAEAANAGRSVEYMRKALADLGGIKDGARILDFGCGHGLHLSAYLSSGLDAYGCDVDPYWSDDRSGRMRAIERPYRIPFPMDHFDAVVSTSVLEHAQNASEVFAEVYRVLRPGGVALHLFPTKHYLPREPHIYVPLANFFWPHVPRFWLALWALLGVRNEHQQGKTWREVVEWNAHYCRRGIAYFTCREYERLSLNCCGNFTWAMDHLIEHGEGGFAALARKMPMRPLWRLIGRHTRMSLLMHRKPIAP